MIDLVAIGFPFCDIFLEPGNRSARIRSFSFFTTQLNSDEWISWNRILVFAFLNFRISTITGLEQLTELKVLNLAGNLIRKVTGVQNLGCVEELNLRCRWKHNHRKKNSLHLKKNVQEEQDKDDGGLAVGAQPAEAVHGQQFIIMIIIFITMMITMIIEGTCQTMRSKGWLPSSSLKASSGCKPCRWRGTRCAGFGFT